MIRLALSCALLACFCAQAQKPGYGAALKAQLDSLNRLIDRSVVKKDMLTLKRLYADDFCFRHAAGRIENKASWMQSVSDPANVLTSQCHDSVGVELHGNVAIISGTLTTKFRHNYRPAYAAWYIRVYALRGKAWQLLSHRSLEEWLLED